MVSFVCSRCDDVVTKPKVLNHLNRCPGASFSCIDCRTRFTSETVKGHTSCITEAQKCHGKYAKGSPAQPKKPVQEKPQGTPVAPKPTEEKPQGSPAQQPTESIKPAEEKSEGSTKKPAKEKKKRKKLTRLLRKKETLGLQIT